MYIWLENKDFDKQIKNDILDRIVQNDQSIILDAERAALMELQGILKVGVAKLDVGAIFSQAGTNRNALLVMLLVDILLYHIHSRLNGNQVPDIRRDRYDSAIASAEKLASGKMDIGLPQLLEEDGTEPNYGGISLQGETKRNNRF